MPLLVGVVGTSSCEPVGDGAGEVGCGAISFPKPALVVVSSSRTRRFRKPIRERPKSVSFK